MVSISPVETMKVLSYYNEIKEILKGNIVVPRTVEFFISDKFKVLGSVEKTILKIPCILTPMHPLIDSSGDVYLCAFWQYRRESFNIGNIYEKSEYKKMFQLENDHWWCVSLREIIFHFLTLRHQPGKL